MQICNHVSTAHVSAFILQLTADTAAVDIFQEFIKHGLDNASAFRALQENYNVPATCSKSYLNNIDSDLNALIVKAGIKLKPTISGGRPDVDYDYDHESGTIQFAIYDCDTENWLGVAHENLIEAAKLWNKFEYKDD